MQAIYVSIKLELFIRLSCIIQLDQLSQLVLFSLFS